MTQKIINDHQLIEKVEAAGQGHVLKYVHELNDASRNNLFDQIRTFDFDLIARFKNEYLHVNNKIDGLPAMEPAPVIPVPRTEEQKQKAAAASRLGEDLIRQGRLGVVLVAGGQGTRLGYDGPKGRYPIGPVTNKSIFHLHAEKIQAASRKYGVSIPWYIMTSLTNNDATQAHFRAHDFFGLNCDDVFFFTQRMLPALTPDGKMILDAKNHVFTSPNGHGGTLLALMESGAIADMKRRGVEMLSYFQVDNVLIRIVDPVFAGYHAESGSEMSSKMLKKRDAHEKLGHFGLVDGKMTVVEYSDMKKADMLAKNADGSLKYEAGSIAIHMINVEFVEKEVAGGFKLPYHVAHKKIPFLDEHGARIIPDVPNGYKFETFIFDALQDTTRSIIMEIRREHEFSPVKNKAGEDSPDTARQDLSNFYAEWLEAAGVSIQRDLDGHVQGMIEISPLFAESCEDVMRKMPPELAFDGSLYLGPDKQ